MEYKGYSFNLNGVFKVENNKKKYALEIFKDNNQVFKSDWIYEDEKRAFKDAKEMINQNSFDTEIIRKNINNENLKNDTNYQSRKKKKFANNIIVTSILLLTITYIVSLFGINDIEKELSMFVYGYFAIGILFIILMLLWGIFVKGNYKLNNKQKKAYSIMWWINLLYNKGPVLPYQDEPLDKEKGWYSSNILILNVIELLPIIFIIAGCIECNVYSLLFYSVIIGCILSFIIYVFSIVWEINDAKSKGEDFTFKRVISPILVILAIALFIYFYIKIVGIQY
jgi:hypothetical protein